MKIRIGLKDPDAVYNTISEYPKEDKEKIINAACDWFGGLEYLTVEIDTEENTCVVIPPRR